MGWLRVYWSHVLILDRGGGNDAWRFDLFTPQLLLFLHSYFSSCVPLWLILITNVSIGILVFNAQETSEKLSSYRTQISRQKQGSKYIRTWHFLLTTINYRHHLCMARCFVQYYFIRYQWSAFSSIPFHFLPHSTFLIDHQPNLLGSDNFDVPFVASGHLAASRALTQATQSHPFVPNPTLPVSSHIIHSFPMPYAFGHLVNLKRYRED